MKSRFGLLALVLIVLFLLREKLRKTGVFRSAARVFNIVFYIYLIALVSAFIYQVFSNIL